MQYFDHRRQLLRAGLALGSALVLPNARACETPTARFNIFHPWTRASAPGETTSIVSMRFESVTGADRLIGAECMVCEGAELGGEGASRERIDFAIPVGETSAFSESGIHLLLTQLKFPLEVARTYPLTLVFEQVGRVQTTLTVDYARFL
jgi:copper(I)-binding protein